MATNYCNTNHILIGLGGTGGKILRDFKKRMFEEFPNEEERSKLPVSLLYVDSDDEMMPKEGKTRDDFRVMGKDASFTDAEFLFIKKIDVTEMLDHPDNYPQCRCREARHWRPWTCCWAEETRRTIALCSQYLWL